MDNIALLFHITKVKQIYRGLFVVLLSPNYSTMHVQMSLQFEYIMVQHLVLSYQWNLILFKLQSPKCIHVAILH